MKPFFYFSRSERRTISVLAIIIIALLTGCWYLAQRESGNSHPTASTPHTKEVEQFLKSVKHADNNYRYSPADKTYPSRHHYDKTKLRWKPRTFNPNTCDSSLLLDMSLHPSQVHGFLKYRRAGARFYDVEDLKRVFVFSSEDIDRMLPYVSFPADPRVKQRLARQKEKAVRDSAYQAWVSQLPVKLKEGEQIDANLADTSDFKTIPGIGSYYARKIVAYRERLGGFLNTSQIKEIEGLPEDIGKWITISTISIRKINLNRMDFKTLVRHPYLNYQQVKAIFQRRSKYGPLSSLQQLSTEEAFTSADLARLAPYVEFE